jgi:hypothetical protein
MTAQEVVNGVGNAIARRGSITVATEASRILFQNGARRIALFEANGRAFFKDGDDGSPIDPMPGSAYTDESVEFIATQIVRLLSPG